MSSPRWCAHDDGGHVISSRVWEAMVDAMVERKGPTRFAICREGRLLATLPAHPAAKLSVRNFWDGGR